MKYCAFSVMVSVWLILCLSSCQTTQNSNVTDTPPAESQEPVDITPIVSESDIIGVWTGGENSSGTHIQYLYFSSSGVYYMAKKDGAPSPSAFTNEYRIASSYSISVNSAGDTICSFESGTFGSYTATIYSSSSMYVSGRTFGGSYRK